MSFSFIITVNTWKTILILCVFHSAILVPQLAQRDIKKLIQEVRSIEGLHQEFERCMDRQNEQLKCLKVQFYHILQLYASLSIPSL